MTYDETLAFLFDKLPMFHRQGAAAIKPGLERIEKICAQLNYPERQIKTIHIAGTNGKGSVSNMLASVLMQAGYKVGLYTSPHFKDFRERIKVNGKCVPRDFVVDFVQRLNKEVDISPSFFEYSTAMAFDFFAKEKVDVAVIETGLGGRLDSTNVIDPILSIITSISLDHTDFLGDTVEEIAAEKAGIIKDNKPVVVGECSPEVLDVFNKVAKIKSSKLFQATQREEFYPDANLSFKEDNQNIVYEACVQLRVLGWDISSKEISNGIFNTIENLGFYGRWYQNPSLANVYFDVAHNPSGIQYVLRRAEEIAPFKQWDIVFGAVKDKDLKSIVKLLPKEAKYFLCAAKVPRACPLDELSDYFAKEGLDYIACSEVKKALERARANGPKTRRSLVFGSFFVVAEALPEKIFEKFS